MTTYVILKRNPPSSPGGKTTLDEIGEQEGSGDESAIKAFLAVGGNAEKFGDGVYHAVPKRSWTPRPMHRKVSFGA